MTSQLAADQTYKHPANRDTPFVDYQDTGLSWLPKIPSHWGVKRLKHCCRRSALYGANESAASYVDEGIRFLRTTDITDNGDLVEGGVYLPPEGLDHYLLSDGDILISRSGTLGRSFVFEHARHGKCAYAGYLVRFIPAPELAPRFAFYFTKSIYFQQWLNLSVIASTIGNVNGQKYANMAIPIPPLDEQRAIAAFLDRETAKIDELIAKKTNLLQLLEAKRTADIRTAITQGIVADVQHRETGIPWLGRIPSHWDTIPVAYLVKFHGGCTPSKENPVFWDGDVPWVTPKDMKVDVIGDSLDHITNEALHRTGLHLVPAPAVLIVVRGMILAHSFPVALTANPVTINQDMKALTPGPKFEAGFLAWLLHAAAPAFFAIVEESGHGTRVLRTDLWSKQKLPVPPLSEQAAIVEHIKRVAAGVDLLVTATRKAIDRLKEYRSGVVTSAVTGQIDVRNYRPEVPCQ